MYKTNRLNYSICNSKKIYAAVFKKSKTNMMVVQMLLFFVSACITHSLVERLSAVTALLGNKDKSPGNKEA